MSKGWSKKGAAAAGPWSSICVAGLGGTLEAFYYAFGDDDVYVIADLPDNVTAAAVSLAVGASGGARLKTVALVTPEEIDAATEKAVAYRPPGA